MNSEELIGRQITNIFVTKPAFIEEGIPGPASYFYIILELDRVALYELGAHKIVPWNKEDELVAYTPSEWEIQNNLLVKGYKIIRIIKYDPEEHYDGSLTLFLENNTTIEHQTTNGDQLFIKSIKI